MLLMQFDKGVYTVIPTIFTQDNYVDYDSVSKLIQHQINFGIKNIVLLGTTSETCTLSESEKMNIVEFVYNHFRHSDKKIILLEIRSFINFRKIKFFKVDKLINFRNKKR